MQNKWTEVPFTTGTAEGIPLTTGNFCSLPFPSALQQLHLDTFRKTVIVQKFELRVHFVKEIIENYGGEDIHNCFQRNNEQFLSAIFQKP